MPGCLITFEGTEGSGKSTQIQRLAQRLASIGREVISVREPGGTPLGEEIRHLLKHNPAGEAMCPETELLLMNASRAQLVREVICPSLERGAIVLCDRYYHSSIAYQVYGRGLDPAQVQRIIEFAVGETLPDLALFLRVPLEVSEARSQQRATDNSAAADRFEKAGRDFFQRVEQGYQALEDSGDIRIRSIDATQPVEEVEKEIWRWVEALILTPISPGQREFKSVGEYKTDGPG